ncbi:MAG: tripartite tricarboxylate transporter substrate-binding protein [Pseudomonadota bacterium]
MSDVLRLIAQALALFVLLPCLLGAGVAGAQSYPTKSVRLIVPFAPGGGLDIMARVIAQPLAAMWGHSVVVDNRSGAGGMLGAEAASKAAADGYTLIMLNTNLAPTAILQGKLAVLNGLSGVIKIAELPQALAVLAATPVSSVKDLVALTKTSRLSYSSAGHGTVGSISMEMLKLATGADITHVPYKGGAPAMTALVSGDVSMGIGSLASTMAFVKSGKVKVIAVASSKRSRLAPDIPTISESVKSVELDNWLGLLGPVATPREIVRLLNAHVLKAIAMPEVQQRLIDNGYDVQGSTPEEFRMLIDSDIAKYLKLIREAKIRVD